MSDELILKFLSGKSLNLSYEKLKLINELSSGGSDFSVRDTFYSKGNYNITRLKNGLTFGNFILLKYDSINQSFNPSISNFEFEVKNFQFPINFQLNSLVYTFNDFNTTLRRLRKTYDYISYESEIRINGISNEVVFANDIYVSLILNTDCITLKFINDKLNIYFLTGWNDNINSFQKIKWIKVLYYEIEINVSFIVISK